MFLLFATAYLIDVIGFCGVFAMNGKD